MGRKPWGCGKGKSGEDHQDVVVDFIGAGKVAVRRGLDGDDVCGFVGTTAETYGGFMVGVAIDIGEGQEVDVANSYLAVGGGAGWLALCGIGEAVAYARRKGWKAIIMGGGEVAIVMGVVGGNTSVSCELGLHPADVGAGAVLLGLRMKAAEVVGGAVDGAKGGGQSDPRGLSVLVDGGAEMQQGTLVLPAAPSTGVGGFSSYIREALRDSSPPTFHS